VPERMLNVSCQRNRARHTTATTPRSQGAAGAREPVRSRLNALPPLATVLAGELDGDPRAPAHETVCASIILSPHAPVPSTPMRYMPQVKSAAAYAGLPRRVRRLPRFCATGGYALRGL